MSLIPIFPIFSKYEIFVLRFPFRAFHQVYRTYATEEKMEEPGKVTQYFTKSTSTMHRSLNTQR
jgi:hypothetical protein